MPNSIIKAAKRILAKYRLELESSPVLDAVYERLKKEEERNERIRKILYKKYLK